MAAAFSTREIRDAFASFATGVTVITAVRPDGKPVGVTANSLSSVSLEPPLLLWCLQRGSPSAPAFDPGACFAVHILAHNQRDLAMHFARPGRDKFEVDYHWQANPSPPQVAEALCRMDCVVHSIHAAGDHDIIVGEVHGFKREPGVPLVFYAGRFGRFAADPRSPHVEVWRDVEGEWF